MTKNASHVVVRHYFDNLPEMNLVTMVCCIVLGVVIVLILLIFIAFIIYVLSQRGKLKQNQPPSTRSRDFSETLMNASRAVSSNYQREVTPCRSGGVPNSVYEDSLDTNGPHIPLSTFKTEVEGSGADSSASSAGLCDVLFPPKHEGEVIFEPPQKLVTFAGRVYATPRPGSRAVSNPEPGVSGSGTTARKSDTVNGSLEWDYFESRRYGASNPSNASETDRKRTVNVCWV